jgi:putative phosphoesterase
MSRPCSVGLISDTHGLLRPEAVRALRGSDAIIHAGDVGDPAILDELARLAPVTVVRGNIDKGAWAASLPETAVLEIGGVLFYVVHNIDDLEIDPAAAGFAAVLHGHSPHPGMREKDGVLYVNPGSAGPRRFSLPISAGRLAIEDARLSAELIELKLGVG